MRDGAVAWAQVPAPATDRVSTSTWWRWPAALFVASFGPTVRTLFISPAPGWVIVLGCCTIGLWVGSLVPERRWWLRWVVAMAAGAATTGAGGAWVAVWATLAILLALWSVLERPPLPGLPTAGHTAVPGVIVLQLVAGFQGRAVQQRVLPVVLTLACCALTWVGSRYERQMAAVIAKVGHVVAVGVGWLLFGVLALPVVLVPWLVDRVAVYDPTAPGRAPAGSRWWTRRPGDVRPSAPWSIQPVAAAPARWARARRGFLLLALVAGGALLVVRYVTHDAPADAPVEGRPDSVPAAFAGASWWPAYAEQMQFVFFDPGPAYNPLRYPRIRDVSGPYINIRGGERRTWTPPAGAAPPLELWMYGGSTTVGMGQRDDHTIASKLAKMAWADGIPLRVRNRGVLGDLHWEEAQRFAWDADAGSVPDMAVFYTGANDVVGTAARNDREGIDGTPVDWTAEVAFLEDSKVRRRRADIGSFVGRSAPDGVTVGPPTGGPVLGPEALGRFVAQQLGIGHEVAARTARDRGVGAYFFWQPSRFTRPVVPQEPQKDPALEQARRTVAATVRADLPPDFIDISGAFDRVDGPVYYDDVHTNEEGARLAAAAIYERIRPELLQRWQARSAPAGQAKG